MIYVAAANPGKMRFSEIRGSLVDELCKYFVAPPTPMEGLGRVKSTATAGAKCAATLHFHLLLPHYSTAILISSSSLGRP